MAFLAKFSHNAVAANVAFLVLVAFLALSGRRGAGHGGFLSSRRQDGDCHGLEALRDQSSKCAYVRAHTPCGPQGYVDYLRLFYCWFGHWPALGYVLLVLWLLVLFYLLGDTASEYFCASLEGLSAALRLPPAIAGVTLLSLGNGAPDVFASVVSFAAAGGTGDVGLNSVLGGALFVSTVVAGVVALAVGPRGAVVERRGFLRDLCFLLLVLCYLLAVLVNGSITVWGAASFLSLYAGYVLLVWASHCCGEPEKLPDLATPLLADGASPRHRASLPLHLAKPPPSRTHLHHFLGLLQMPLYLPRRLTIPDIAAARWSKPCAVASAALSPALLATIWISQSAAAPPPLPYATRLAVLLGSALLGLLLAILAAETTDAAAPPPGRWRRLPWLAAGFLMSVIWAYMLARELVALLAAIGYILGIKPSVLGVTVLAWGNSLGDLVSDVAMAVHGGPGGAQVAVSGCYAGPLFNTVVGLGLSLTLAAGARHPDPFLLPPDGSLFLTLGFLGGGLLWALFVLPIRGMRLDRVFGVGLLGIYLCFLCLRLCESLGVLRIPGGSFNVD